jgi:diamine N-acetyltransferase
MTPEIIIRQMKQGDLEMLHNLCRDVYSKNFYQHWDDDGLELYLDDVFAMDRMKIELSGKEIQYYTAFANQEPVGFMKINLYSDLPGTGIKKGMELDKIYVLPEVKRTKIGKKLLGVALDIAAGNQKEILWLSVIDTNIEAISFYEKAGFRFHSKTELSYPKFKKELRCMWRMYFVLPGLNRVSD